MSKRKAETEQDQQIVCKDCSGGFTFTVREQTAFAAKGFQAKVRCAECTKAKKVRRARTVPWLHTRCTRALHAHCTRTAHACTTSAKKVRRARTARTLQMRTTHALHAHNYAQAAQRSAGQPHWHRTGTARAARAPQTHARRTTTSALPLPES